MCMSYHELELRYDNPIRHYFIRRGKRVRLWVTRCPVVFYGSTLVALMTAPPRRGRQGEHI